jgi:hypothetical protein
MSTPASSTPLPFASSKITTSHTKRLGQRGGFAVDATAVATTIPLAELRERLAAAGSVCVLTGSGISAESGLPALLASA